jgi:hypothetical protein
LWRLRHNTETLKLWLQEGLKAQSVFLATSLLATHHKQLSISFVRGFTLPFQFNTQRLLLSKFALGLDLTIEPPQLILQSFVASIHEQGTHHSAHGERPRFRVRGLRSRDRPTVGSPRGAGNQY